MRYLKKKIHKIRIQIKIIIICCLISAVLIFTNLPVFLLNYNKSLKVENNLKFNSLPLHTSNSNILWNYTTGGDMISISLSSDSNYIVAGGSDNKVYFFDKLSSTPLWAYSTEGNIISVSISSDGNYIVAGSEDDNIYLFDKSSSTPLWTYTAGDDISSVTISSDGNYVVAGSEDDNIYLFDKSSSTPLWNYTAGEDISSVTISSDGNYIVAGSYDDKVYLFNKLSSTFLWNYNTGDAISSVAISSDGNYIVAGSYDDKVYLFDKLSSTPLWNYTTGEDISSVAISSDGNYIVTGSQDNKVHLFNKTNSTPLWNYSADNFIKSISISSDGNYIVAGSQDNKVYFFDKSDSTPLWVQSTGGEVGSVSISSDGKYIAGISDWKVFFIYTYLSNDLILFSNSGNPDKDGSFELRWTPFKGADNYSLYYNHNFITEINSSITLLESGIITNNYFVRGFTGGNYYFIIVAYNSSGSYLSNNIYIKIRPDIHDFSYQVILLILFFSIISIVSLSVVYAAKRKPRYYPFESLKMSSSTIMEELLDEMPEIRGYLNSNKSYEKIPQIKEISLTVLSPEELNKIDLIDLTIEEKKLFIKEILSLDNQERKELIDELLESGNK
jgi:WD40 repeat protein